MEEPKSWDFRKFEGPWSDVETLGCRNLFYGQRLMLDLFEYQRSSPDEEVTVGGEVFTGSHIIGLTEASRLWRITFDRPFAVRVRDGNIHRKELWKLNLPASCNFAEDSEWIREFDLRSAPFIPTHYIFELLDDLVEILGQDQPQVETIQNDLPSEGSGEVST